MTCALPGDPILTLSSPLGLLFKRSITADQSLDFCIPQILTVEDALPIATEDLRRSWGSLIHTEQVIVFRDTLSPRCCHFKTSTTRQRLHQIDPKRKIFARRGHGSTHFPDGSCGEGAPLTPP